MTDNLDELKRKWQEMSARVEKLEETNKMLTEKLANGKVSSLQEKLAMRIRRVGYVGFLLPILAPSLVIVLDFPLWYAMLYGILGVVAAANSINFSRYIMRDNLTALPVAQAIERVARIRMRHQRTIIAGFAVLIVFLVAGYFVLPPSEANTEILTGGLVGAIVGLFISIPRVLTNQRMIKKLVESLEND